ncbi:hypothetical protein [Aliiruegeria sabulilitoris]|uniref:hypothetical protein n=1 Tax=Aliiruegeria sabulilitoris TaxID=1510458 RepID=UPI0008351FC9|nr:hypothetical protein [Aliiruegeria sabulilitoris]NDR59647.1 hypothetical protein [Pseudoruegeria sp. M32A2M]
MRTAFIILPLGLSLLACTEPPAGQSLPLMGGYRDPADQCVRVGENAFTNQFLDHTADLVGCPVGYEGTGVFVTETGGVLVAQADGYELYSVPRN